MINKLVIENLKHRWLRTVLCALVVGVQVMSILTLIGLSRGMLEDSAHRASGTGADIWLKPGGTFRSQPARSTKSLSASSPGSRTSPTQSGF